MCSSYGGQGGNRTPDASLFRASFFHMHLLIPKALSSISRSKTPILWSQNGAKREPIGVCLSINRFGSAAYMEESLRVVAVALMTSSISIRSVSKMEIIF